MTATVLLSGVAQPDKIDELKALLERCLVETRAYPGFISINIYEDIESPGSFVFYEKWETIKAYEAYLTWRTSQGIMEKIGNLLTSPPDIRYYNLLDI
ncbi:MAG: antibiotic biosynthesis monooxygenase [Chromatiales bacterium]|nr:antibiotic biosynthesis monooxygenase [Chromatiales bacterium]